MNRNPGRPKLLEPLARVKQSPGYVYIPLMVLAVSVLIVGLHYLFGG